MPRFKKELDIPRKNAMSSKAHKILVRRAKKQLIAEGYEVYEEYQIEIENKTYYIDVVGIKNSYKVAIECGRTKYSKILKLVPCFDSVIKLGYSRKIYPKKYPMECISKVHSKGRVQIPLEIRNELNLKDGDKVLWFMNFDGKICLEKVKEKPKIRFIAPNLVR